MRIDFFANVPTPQLAKPQAPAAATPAAATEFSLTSDRVSIGGTYTVRNTDNLWNISQKTLGDATRWPEIYSLNQDKVTDPDLIFPGTVLKLPAPRKPEHKPEAHKPEHKPEAHKPEHKPEAHKPEHKPEAHQPETKPTTEPTSQTPAQPSQPTQSQTPAEPNYPTVGEYVKKRVSDSVDSTVTGLHGAAEIAMPPLLLGEIAAIKAKHEKAAMDRIWDLPMDPQGHWKVVAKQISDQESAKANAEIRDLPAVRALSATGDAIGDAATWTGHQIANGANAVVDGAVQTGVAIGKGVEWTGQQIQSGAQAVGHGFSVAGGAVVDGATWVGHQAVEAPKAAARGVLNGIGGIGDGLVHFSKWALGGLD